MVIRATVLSILACGFFSSVAHASPWYAEAAIGTSESGNLALGYQFRPYLGLEAGYRRSDGGFDFPSGNDAHRNLGEVDGFEVALRSAVQVTPRFALTGRFGLYAWDTQYLVFDIEGNDYVVDRDDVSPIVGLGLRAKLTERLDFTSEYTASESATGDGMLTAGLRLQF